MRHGHEMDRAAATSRQGTADAVAALFLSCKSI